MSEPLTETDVVAIDPRFRLQWEEAQDAYVLLYPEGMVQLNGAAGEILNLCDGGRTVGDIVKVLAAEFPEDDIKGDVLEFLQSSITNGWTRVIRD